MVIDYSCDGKKEIGLVSGIPLGFAMKVKSLVIALTSNVKFKNNSGDNESSCSNYFGY